MAKLTSRTLTTEAEIAAYLHRTRMAILDVLRDGPATATQIGARLGVHPANLTRHIRVLRGAGLVDLVETRATTRNVEKYYAAAAERFVVSPDGSHLTAPHRIALNFARSALSAAVARLPDETTDLVMATTLDVRVSAENAAALAEQLQQLHDRVVAAHGSGTHAYEVVMALYPGDTSGDEREETIEFTREEQTR